MAASPGQALAGLIQRLSQAVALSAGNQPDVVACHEGLRGVRPGRPRNESGPTVGRGQRLDSPASQGRAPADWHVQ